MTELLFQTDSYLKELEAMVVETNPDENAVALDRTAFYPGGGGQPNDVGLLLVGDHSLPVTKVKWQGGQVWHWVDGALPAVGTTVTGRLDWDGGTHVANTREVGCVRIVDYKSKGRINKRIHIELDA